MKKRIIRMGFVFTAAFVFMMAVAGCGQKEETTVSETPGTEVIAPTCTPIPEPEEIKEEPTEADAFDGIAISGTMNKIGLDHYDSKDQINVYSRAIESTMPYYVGRDNQEENIDFMKNHKASGDGFIYLGLPMYLPDEVKKDTAYVAVSDETVAKVEGNELVALKQGLFTLFSYDAEKNLIEEKNYVATTFNDSKANKESFMTISASQGVHVTPFVNARDITYWKDSVHTIMDMCYLLQARHFKYDFNGEPEFACIDYVSNQEDRWTWVHNAKTIFEMSKGVCIQVAQLATYMLADDYEDWGVIYIEGMQGHVFNWFFEDGYYYVFDFTQVISDNAWGREGDQYYEYWDYSNEVRKFQTIEELTEWCTTEKVNVNENYLIYMISCLGHDYLPCSLNTGMSDSVGCLHGTYNNGTITMGFQDVVFEKLEVLFHKKGSVDINFITKTAEELNNSIPYGVYGDTEELEYRFNY